MPLRYHHWVFEHYANLLALFVLPEDQFVNEDVSSILSGIAVRSEG